MILIWKDNKISRWFIDTSNRQNSNKLLQFISLQLRSNATITSHEEDIVLGIMSIEKIQKYNFKPNQLLRFSITNADMNECRVDNLLYIKRCSVSKMQADTWSKIVFQHQAKNGISIKFDDLAQFAIMNEEMTNKFNGARNDQSMMKLENDHDWDREMENIEATLRIATLGLNDFHL